MRKSALLLLMAFALAKASAQPGPRTLVSIDALILNTHYACVGAIENEGPAMSQMSPGDSNVTVLVETRLKGELSDRTQFQIRASEGQARAWAEHHTRLLMIEHQRPIDLDDPNLLVITADLRALHTAKDVISAARDAIENHVGVTAINTFSRYIPRTLRDSDLRGWECVVVPADEALQRSAIEQLNAEDAIDRADAVQALRCFRSEQNIQRLKRMLTDTGVALYSHPSQNHGRTVYMYVVRQRAWEALTTWGVKVSAIQEFTETPVPN